MGEVFRARDTKLREVGLKLLPEPLILLNRNAHLPPLNERGRHLQTSRSGHHSRRQSKVNLKSIGGAGIAARVEDLRRLATHSHFDRRIRHLQQISSGDFARFQCRPRWAKPSRV